MGRRVHIAEHAILAAGDYFPFAHHHGSNGHFAGFSGKTSLGECGLDCLNVCHHWRVAL
jgi:hypothetical protein